MCIRDRINTRYPAELFIIAKKVGEVPERLVIQQSDYIVRWNGEKDLIEKANKIVKKTCIVRRIFSFLIPRKIKLWKREILNKNPQYHYYNLKQD